MYWKDWEGLHQLQNVTIVITMLELRVSSQVRKTERKRSDWPSQSEQHHHRPFVYLRPRSRLYCPPYLHRFPASSVISGIQLANTAYIGYKNQQTTNQTLSLACTPWPSTTKPTWNLMLLSTSFSLKANLDSNSKFCLKIIICTCGVLTFCGCMFIFFQQTIFAFAKSILVN